MATAVHQNLSILPARLPITSTPLSLYMGRETYQNIGSHHDDVHSAEIPKCADYDSHSARLESFYGWNCLVVNPTDLANSGFYYTGIKDYVRCFFCGGGIKDWEMGDNPWSEHVKWYPHCGYIKRGYQGLMYASDNSTQHSQQAFVLDDTQHDHTTDANSTYNKPSTESSPIFTEDAEPEARDLLEENRILKEKSLCKICLDKEACSVFLPCCHLVSCVQCSCVLKKCAVCRADIKEIIRVYQA